MTKSKRLIFFGNEQLATGVSTKAPTLRHLLADGHEILAVILNQKVVQSRRAQRLEIAELAKTNNIPLITGVEPAKIVDKIKEIKPDAAILVAYGEILPAEIIDALPGGVINIHPSLLPRYRGSSPIETAILDNATKSGVSLMRLTEKTDAGPVYAQRQIELTGQETKQELADKLANIGAELLSENLDQIIDGSLRPVPQEESEASYTKRLKKSDGLINWRKQPEQIAREVRAYQGWPKSRTDLFDHEVVVTSVRVAENEHDGRLVMPAGDGWLEIEELIAPSGRTMPGAAFIRGYKK